MSGSAGVAGRHDVSDLELPRDSCQKERIYFCSCKCCFGARTDLPPTGRDLGPSYFFNFRGRHAALFCLTDVGASAAVLDPGRFARANPKVLSDRYQLMLQLVHHLLGLTVAAALRFPDSAPKVQRPVPTLAHPLRVDIGLHDSVGRRAVCGSLLAVAALATSAVAPAAAKVDSVNPANNYYFPMARYRYAPRIFRAWIAVDELAPGITKAVPYDWEGMEIVWYRMDDATTAMPLFTNAVEGSRSTKRKTKSDTQKAMTAATKAYAEACKMLRAACDRKDPERVLSALAKAKTALGEYRVLAKIDGPDGGMVVPENTAEGRGGAPDAQYVVPVFSGGAAMTKEDFRRLR